MSLAVDPWVMNGEELKHDQLWVTDEAFFVQFWLISRFIKTTK